MDDNNKFLFDLNSSDTEEAIHIDFDGEIYIDVADEDDESPDVLVEEESLEDFSVDEELDTDREDETDFPVTDPSVFEPKVDEEFDNQFFKPKDNKNFKKTIFVAAFFLIAVVLLTVFAYIFTHRKIKDDHRIYSGVSVNGYDLGGMTRDEVADYIRKTYFDPINNAKITVKFEDDEDSYRLTDFVVCPNAEEIAEKAYNIGRTGTESERVAKIKALETRGESILIEYQIVTDKLSDIVKKAEEKGYATPVDPSYILKSEGVEFTAGKKGMSINLEQFKSDINDVIVKFENEIANISSDSNFENAVVNIIVTEADFKNLNADVIFNEVFKAPSSAKYERNGSKLSDDIVVKEGSAGRTLNMEKLKETVDKINNDEAEPYMMLKYEFTEPDDSASKLKSRLYVNQLSYVTSLNTEDSYSDDGGTEKRAKNMDVMCSKIGTIQLLGGEYFNIYSFARELSEQNGYVMAQENILNGGSETLGGGTAQVASAIYEAALKAGLTVDNASHNKFMPCYGTAGFDAVYTGGSNALTIRNTTGNPLRITVNFDGETIIVTIDGNKSDKTKGTLSSELKNTVASGEDIIYTYATTANVAGLKTTASVEYIVAGGSAEPSESPTEIPTETPTETEETPTETPSETPSEPTPSEPTSTPSEPTPTPSEPTPTPSEPTPSESAPSEPTPTAQIPA